MSLILSGSDGLSDVDGSAATPAIRGTDSNTGIFFPAADTIAFAEGGTEVMRVDSSGNVGIGTSSPSDKLHVVGNVRSSGADAGFYALATTGTASIAAVSSARYWRWMTSNADSSFRVVDESAAAERLRIDSSGNLLVGTTSAIGTGARLQVFQTSGTDVVALQTNTTSTQGIIRFYNPNGAVGNINTSGSATAYVTSSDYRLKEDIAPMTGALAKVAALKPVTYKWKSDGSDGQGFIAHELAEVCPDAVIGEKDAVNEDGSINPQGIDTSFLVATLTAAIQELKGIVDSQAARIAALEGAAQ